MLPSKNLTQDHLLKIDRLITDPTTVGSPLREVKVKIFGLLLMFLAKLDFFVVGELLCGLETPSQALTTLHEKVLKI